MKDKLIKLLENSYAPYSKYCVSCILLTKDGNEFLGVNVENASYGATICAERSAIVSAISYGYKKGDFNRIFIMNNSGDIGTPCMMCRQVFIEFFDADIEIICMDKFGNEKQYSLNDLCPEPFSKEDLI